MCLPLGRSTIFVTLLVCLVLNLEVLKCSDCKWCKLKHNRVQAHSVWPAQASGAAAGAGDKAAKAAKSGAAEGQKAADGAEREAKGAGEAASQVRLLASACRWCAACTPPLQRRFTVSYLSLTLNHAVRARHCAYSKLFNSDVRRDTYAL